VGTYVPLLPSVKPASKRLLSNLEIVLIVVAVVAVIVIASIFIFTAFNAINTNQANGSNNSQFNTFSFGVLEGKGQINVPATDLVGKAGFSAALASLVQPSNRFSPSTL
jgi:hypothetical protein